MVNCFFIEWLDTSPRPLESNRNINLYALYTVKNGQTTHDIYPLDRWKTYDYNPWHASIQTRWRDATLALWWIAKQLNFLKIRLENVERNFFPIKKNRSKVATLAAVGYDNFSFAFFFKQFNWQFFTLKQCLIWF